MIYALLDYISYKGGKGYYSLSTDPIMKWAIKGRIPDDIIRDLRKGDPIFVYTGNSKLAWAVMYMTNSRMSHVCTYIGDTLITHQTLGGVVVQPISDLFGEDMAFLVCHLWKIKDELRERVDGVAERFKNSPYSMKAVVLKFVHIISGRDKPYFRIRFLIDILILLCVLDIAPILIFGFPVFLWVMIPYILLIFMNFAAWERIPIPFDHLYVKPIDIYLYLYSHEEIQIFTREENR